MLRPMTTSWRSIDAYSQHMVHFKNALLKYGGGVFSPDFEMPEYVEPIR